MNTRTGMKLWALGYSLVPLITGLVAIVGLQRAARLQEAVLAESSGYMESATRLVESFDQLEYLVLTAVVSDQAADAEGIRRATEQIGAQIRVLGSEVGRTGAGGVGPRAHESWGQYCGALSFLGHRADPANLAGWRQTALRYVQAGNAVRRDLRVLARAAWEARGMERLHPASDWHAWSMMVALLTCVGLMVAFLRHRHLEEALAIPLQRLRATVDRAKAGELHLRIPADRGSLLGELTDSCNRLIEAMEGIAQGSRLMIRQGTQLASVLIESFAEPAMVASPAGEPLMCNAAMRTLLEGETGAAVLLQLGDRIRAGGGALAIAGTDYRTCVSEVSSVADFPGLFVRLQKADAKGEARTAGGAKRPRRGAE